MAEVLEFRAPTGNGRTLLVFGLESDTSEHALYLTFSAFGLLYSVRVCKNAPVAEPGYHAFVKFYSARDAGRAQSACHQQPLFQKSPLKVSMCTRLRSFPNQVWALNSNKCKDLANHYLGFNGWSSRIITLQNISGFEEDENEEEERRASHHSQYSKYLCIQELTFPQHGICTRGVGVAELQLDPSQEFVTAIHGIQKLAVQRALTDAFQKIFLIVLENGKVAVEYSSPQEDLIDCLTEEDLKGLVQVHRDIYQIYWHELTLVWSRNLELMDVVVSYELEGVNRKKLLLLELKNQLMALSVPRSASDSQTEYRQVTDLSLSTQTPNGEEEILSDLSLDD